MKAINYYIVVEKIKEEPKKVGGLELTESQNSDVRYLKAKVISTGNLVEGIADGDIFGMTNMLVTEYNLTKNFIMC